MTVNVLRTIDLERLRRVHIQAFGWGDELGTDYWLFPGPGVNGATTKILSDVGWTLTSLGITAGSGADFISAADKGTPRTILHNASGDLISSPVVFGDYQHARAASLIMGRTDLPRYLIMDAFAAFTTASANEDTSGFGLIEDGGAITTAGDHMAVIVSDGTNFIARTGADSSTGAAVDTNYHWWRILIDRTIGATNGARWYIDGVSQGTFDVQADEWPVHFAAHSLTTNRIALGTTHIFYAWDLANVDQLTA